MGDVVANIRIIAIDQASATLAQIGAAAQNALKNASQQMSQGLGNANLGGFSSAVQDIVKQLEQLGSGSTQVGATVAQGMQQATGAVNALAQSAGKASKTVEDAANKVQSNNVKTEDSFKKISLSSMNLEQAFRHPVRALLDLSSKLQTTDYGMVRLVAVSSLAVGAVAAVGAAFVAATVAIGAFAVKLAGEVVQAIQSVIKGFVDLAQQTAPLESLRYAFANFAEGADAAATAWSGTADSLISDMRRATYGALNTTEMLKSANLAFMLIGEQVASELPRLLAIAQSAAIATGQDLDFMFSSLVRGVGRLSSRWLDNLGIVVRAEDEYDRYAKSINKVAENLTQAERVEAMMQGALREGEKMMLRVGDVSGLLSVRVGALQASFTNLHDSILSMLAPLFSVIIGEVNTLVDTALPKIEQFVSGFMDALAQLPAAAGSAMNAVGQPIAAGSEEAMMMGIDNMGRAAADWAVGAATWGANVGAQFAIGILNGFTAMIVGVMNTIAGIISSWFAPGSPPRVAPEIDQWGAKTIGEWINGMLGAATTLNLGTITDALQKQLEGGVKQQLFDWGVSAIEAWAEGLSIIDLEFLIKNVEKQLDKAKKSVDALTGHLSKQRRELFKLQVLNKDPSAIRNQMRQVQTTESMLKGAKSELETLEERRDALKDQLELFRLLLRAIKDMQTAASGGGAGAGMGGGMGGIELPEPIHMPMGVGGDLTKRLEGIKETLDGIFASFGDVATTFEDDMLKIQTAWENLVAVFDTSTLPATIDGMITDTIDAFSRYKTSATRNIEELRKTINDAFKTNFGIGKIDIGPIFRAGWWFAINFWLGVSNGLVTGLNAALQGENYFVGFFEGLSEQFDSAGFTVEGKPATFAEAMMATFKTEFEKSAAELVAVVAQWAAGLVTIVDVTILTFLNNLVATWSANFAMLGIIATAAWGVIVRGAAILVQTVLDTFNKLKANLYLTFNTIKTDIVMVWEEIKTKIATKAQEIYDKVVGKIQEILDWIKEQWSTLVSLGESIIDGLKQGVLNKAGELIEAAKKAISDALAAARAALGNPQSPSPVFERLGETIPEGLLAGMDFAPVARKVEQQLGWMRNLGISAPSWSGGNGAGGGMLPTTRAGDTTIQFNEPLVETLVVPNARVGRQFAQDLSVEIGNMIAARRVSS